MKIPNVAPGVKIKFLHFRGNKPSAAVFTREDFEDGFFGPAELIAVPLRGRPRSKAAERRACAWAKRQVLATIGEAT